MLGNDRIEVYQALRKWKGAHLVPDERIRLDRLLDSIERQPKPPQSKTSRGE